MVLDDVFSSKSNDLPKPNLTEDSLESRLARPVDRIAAFVADLVVFLPIMALVISPFRRHSIDAQIMGNEDAWFMAIVSASIAGVIAFILYQTVFVAVFGATPGKMALRLKVVSVWGQRRVRSLEAFLRSLTWCLELVFFAAPFIAVFGNEKRRPLHDRIAETVVVVESGRKGSSGAPSLAEMSLAAGVHAAVLACCALVLSFQLFHQKSGEPSHSARVAADMEDNGQLCKEVGEAQRTWQASPERSLNSVETPSRLNVAMTMFMADLLDENCLKMEADYALWNDEDKPLGYLARGLSDSADDKVYDAYLNKACKSGPRSDACKMVQLIRSSDDEELAADMGQKEAEIEGVISKIVQAKAAANSGGSAYLKVWAIRHLMEKGAYDKALAMIDSSAPSQYMGAFFARERAMALWLNGQKDEARLAMRTSIDLLDSDSGIELSRWFCSNETAEEGCSDASRVSCGLLSAAVDRTTHLLASPEIAATYLRSETCREQMTGTKMSTAKIRGLEKNVADRDGKSYLEALAFLEKNQRARAVDSLNKIATARGGSGPFYFAANNRLAELANSSAELSAIRERWMNEDSGEEGWKLLGYTLFKKLDSLHAWDQTLSVGLKMANLQKNDRSLYKPMIVAAFRAGHTSIAQSLLEHFAHDEVQSQMQQTAAVRQPASDDEYVEVVKELEQRKTGAK